MSEPTISGGLVEISTVATLIGAPIAEALVHGLRGAGGLAWAPMSSFGLLHVIKACLAAAVPDWARESSGLRNQHVDDALGLVFPLRPTEAIKNRVDLGDARAVLIDRTFRPGLLQLGALRRHTGGAGGGGKNEDKLKTEGSEGSGAPGGGVVSVSSVQASEPPKEPRISRLYCLDRKTALLLAAVRRQVDGGEVPIYWYLPDTDGSPTYAQDWIVLVSSLAKLCEVFWLWKWGSQILWITTAIPWAWGFVAAALLQVLDLGRDNPTETTVDIVAGALPTPLTTGGEGVIVLGTPPNVRRSPARRMLMGLGMPLNLVPLFITFLNMQREKHDVAYLWVAFQALWLICRGLVYYLAESAAAVRQAVLETKAWSETDKATQQRVLLALDAVVRHQATIHPRGPKVYLTECTSFLSIPSFLCQAGWQLTTEIDLDAAGNLRSIEVLNAVGDIFFRTVVWAKGADLNNGELYDSCLLFIRTPDPATRGPQDGTGSGSGSGSGSVKALACVRARACDCPLYGKGVRQRGNTHLCPTKRWRTFIRCRRGGAVVWMYIHAHSMIGEHSFDLLSDEEINTSFATGAFRISFQNTGQLQTAWDASLRACELLMAFMADNRKQ
ncbi:hypothetical protein MFIFM68171_06514 [Madurella fahalii]|uniref:Uncharacterized protein n=1 Tax=Madurella fahalii TaxID=1157608 RepID=A0ABQ0GF53_9PEZI